jgi:HlyD family secretion protein
MCANLHEESAATDRTLTHAPTRDYAPEPVADWRTYDDQVKSIVVAAAILTVTASGCSRDRTADVAVATVGTADVVEIVSAPATVTARAQSTLVAPAEGTVADLYVRAGQTVRGGQRIARIESPSARERLRAAKAADARAAGAAPASTGVSGLTGFQSQVDAAAEAAFTASRTAAASAPEPARSEALQTVARAERRYAAAQAQSRQALRQLEQGFGNIGRALSAVSEAQRVQTRAAVSVAQDTVDRLLIRATIGGTVQLGGGGAAGGGSSASDLIGQLPPNLQGQAQQALGSDSGATDSAAATDMAVGVPVSSGSVVAQVFDISTLGLAADVDETDVLLVRRGVRADVEFDALPGAKYTARVSAVDIAPNTSSRGGVSYRVRLSLNDGVLPNGDRAPVPRPGMSAVANLRVRQATGALAVPAAAVVREGARDAVWVSRSGVAELRIVELGAQGDEMVQVSEGLKPGDRVVVRGADSIEAGQRLP